MRETALGILSQAPLASGEGRVLLELKVRDLGIIEEMSWSLSRGLNVVTGETGAGKSLIIDALEALLAGRLDEEDIRYGASEAQIEGVFALPRSEGISRLKELLMKKGIEADDAALVLSCELRRQGRSILRVNGHAVPRGLIQQIGDLLVDIHGQSDHLSLLDKRFQLDILDCYAHNLELRNSFTAKAAELYKAEQELRELIEKERDSARRVEFLRFQLDEIKRAGLREGEEEEEELVRERNIITSCEKLKALSYEAYQALHGDDAARPSASALDRLNEAAEAVKRLAELDPALKQQLGLLEETLYRIEELSRDIRSYGDSLEYSPQRLEEIESRLELLRSLKRKYGQTAAEILDYRERVERELEGIAHSSQRRAELEQRCSLLKEALGRIGFQLSGVRADAAMRLEAEVKKELQDLNMSQVEFKVEITQVESPDGISLPNGKACAFNSEGIDNVEFFASTNPGEPSKPLGRIASAGELSRFMLALKGALSQADNMPVLVFDEIDIGIGGRSGEIIGRKLSVLARDRQVICVTHLPQLAAFADAHYTVHKEVCGDRTLSRLETMKGEPRLRELAVMLAGSQYTQTSMNNARELVQRAEKWKKNHG